eukprot:UN27696
MTSLLSELDDLIGEVDRTLKTKSQNNIPTTKIVQMIYVLIQISHKDIHIYLGVFPLRKNGNLVKFQRIITMQRTKNEL